MQELVTVTHLVHIGYDGNTQPDFEARLEKYLQTTADEATHILNFVDEAMYSDMDILSLEENYFAEALVTCISMQQAQSFGFFHEQDLQEYISRQSSKMPPEVFCFIKELLGENWYLLARKIDSFENWKKGKMHVLSGLDVPPKSILYEIEQHDNIIKKIKSEQFDDFLHRLIQRFGGQNIFGFYSSNTPRNDRVLNPSRREKILQKAESYFGKERIIFSGMRDGDRDKLRHALLGESWDREVEILRAQAGVKQEVWEMMYGNADERLLQKNRELTLSRFERLRLQSFHQLQAIGYIVTNTTNHRVGGEYYGRCVHAWLEHVLIYGVQSEKITAEKDISLSHLEEGG